MNKINTIRAGQAIKEILSSDTTVKSLVDNKIYPVQINVQEATYPYIVYSRTNITDNGTKDYNPYSESCTIYVTCFSNDYDNSLDIAEAVTNALVHASGTYANINVSDIRFTNIDENFESDCYMQTLSFNLTT